MDGDDTTADDVQRWLLRAASRVEPSLQAGRRLTEQFSQGALAAAVATADLLATEVEDALSFLALDPCPDQAAGGELRACIAVYRNAAFVLRRWAVLHDGGSEHDRAGLASSCRALLEQGRIHQGAFEHMMETWRPGT